MPTATTSIIPTILILQDNANRFLFKTYFADTVVTLICYINISLCIYSQATYVSELGNGAVTISIARYASRYGRNYSSWRNLPDAPALCYI